MDERICCVDGCALTVLARGWCSGHYQRQRKHGEPGPAVLQAKPRRRALQCSIEGCERDPNGGQNMCPKHYQRVVRYSGDPHVGKVQVVGVEPCVIPDCANVQRGRGWCTRHWTNWSRFGEPVVVRRCAACSLSFEVSDARRRYCSGECQRVGARLAGRLWAQVRRKRLAAAMVEDFDVLEVFVRDDWTCQLCAEPIDLQLRHPEPMSPSLDHIIPLARGGEHSRANTQAAHLVCNMRKGATTTITTTTTKAG